MKKAALTAGLVLIAVAAIVVVKSFPVSSPSAGAQNSERAASGLQTKIDAIKKADADKKRRVQTRVDITEVELESYVMVYLRKDIPIRIDSIRVHLTPGVIAADTRLTIPAGSTGNVLVDALVSGTHNMFVGGKMTASKGVGKFDLQSVTIDGIPVPNIIVDTLLRKYAKPKYPDVDLKEPFDLLYGIESIEIGQGKATITY